VQRTVRGIGLTRNPEMRRAAEDAFETDGYLACQCDIAADELANPLGW